METGTTVTLITVPVSAQEETVEEPVYEAITFYLHGTEDIGELDATSLGHMPMDTVAPTDSSSKSRGITNYVRGPNNRCSGNSLLPTWDGFMSGRVEGDVRVVLNTLTHLVVRAPSNPVAGQPTSQPHQGRVYYDSVAQASRVELQCLLPEGKTTCVY